MKIEYRMQSAEPQKADWHFEILQSAIDILRFKKQQRYFSLCQLQDGLFEMPKIKPPVLPEDTYLIAIIIQYRNPG